MAERDAEEMARAILGCQYRGAQRDSAPSVEHHEVCESRIQHGAALLREYGRAERDKERAEERAAVVRHLMSGPGSGNVGLRMIAQEIKRGEHRSEEPPDAK